MSKSMKDVIISTMDNGAQVLQELAMAKKSGADIEEQRHELSRKIREYHPKSLLLRVVEKEHLDPLATRVRLTAVEGFLPVFEAGQYINLFVEIDGCRTSRPYSLANPPSQRAYFEIIVARKQGGFVSDYLIDRLPLGEVLKSSGPMGVFRYQALFHKRHQVMLAGGSGITPMQSMILDCLERGLEREITLFYGVRQLAYATNHERFLKLAAQHKNFRYIPVLSHESVEGLEEGFLSRALIQKYVAKPEEASYFLCGPEVMNEFCCHELEEMGIRRAMIRRELFQSRADIEHEPGWPEGLDPETEFEISCGGRRLRAKAGESILTALERGNFEVNVGCRSGECSYCRMKLVSGRVFTARGSLQRRADEVFGYIHSCKTYPISDLELMF